MDEDFDLLSMLKEEIGFCKKLQLKITGIEIGVEVLHSLARRDLVLWQGEAQFVYGLPIKISTSQNPWTIRFERHERINK
jgi:hypothetical protein